MARKYVFKTEDQNLTKALLKANVSVSEIAKTLSVGKATLLKNINEIPEIKALLRTQGRPSKELINRDKIALKLLLETKTLDEVVAGNFLKSDINSVATLKNIMKADPELRELLPDDYKSKFDLKDADYRRIETLVQAGFTSPFKIAASIRRCPKWFKNQLETNSKLQVIIAAAIDDDAIAVAEALLNKSLEGDVGAIKHYQNAIAGIVPDAPRGQAGNQISEEEIEEKAIEIVAERSKEILIDAVST